MGCLYVVVTPLGSILALSWLYMILYYAAGVLFGYACYAGPDYKRPRISPVRNNEEMKHAYDAEAKGVGKKTHPADTGPNQAN